MSDTDRLAQTYALRCACWQNGYRPLAVYSPGAQLRGTLIKGAGKRPVGSDWLKLALQYPPDVVASSHRVSPLALNTGLLTGDISGLDIDVRTQDVVDQIVSRIEQTLGPTPLSRIGNAPKIMLCYRAAAPFAKLSTPDFQMPDGSKGQFEILGQGQHFVAFGIHPETWQPYRWLDRSPVDVPLMALPEITVMQARDLIGEVGALLVAAGGVVIEPPKPVKPEQPSRQTTASGLNGSADKFFRQVNSAALDNIAAWAQALHADFRDRGNSGWRLRSKALGRDLQEDIAIHPTGIRDFGEEVPLTAIDLTIKLGAAYDATAAAFWLCQRLGQAPATLGWCGRAPGGNGLDPTAGHGGNSSSNGGGGGGGNAGTSPPLPDGEVYAELLRQLRIDIAQLNCDSSPEEIAAIVDRIASDIHDDIARDSLLRTLKAQTNTSLGPLRKRLEQTAKTLRQLPPPPPPPPPPDADPPPPWPAPGATLADFYAYLPGHKFIYVPTRELWPADSVNDRFGMVATGAVDHKGHAVKVKASILLSQVRPVEQMTWFPAPPHEPPVIRDRLVNDGGWFVRPGATIFNLYLPPPRWAGDPEDVEPWLNHIRKIYPDDLDHIVRWLAHRVQKPWDKINHALVLGGTPRIGKDTMVEPVKQAIGAWNFKEASPVQVMDKFNDFVKGVILRINETRDLGDNDRYSFYEHMKPYIAAPPDVLRVNEKNIPAHQVSNVIGIIETTNHKAGGMYLPADDGRHYVAWSESKREDFSETYWTDLWAWYDNRGTANVAAYLAQPERLTGFNPKAPPPRTPAFWDFVNADVAPEVAELRDVLETIDAPTANSASPPYTGPQVVTLSRIIRAVGISFATASIGDWLKDRRNRRQIPHRMEACGYVPVRSPTAEDGLWIVEGKRQVVYGKNNLSRQELISLIERAIKEGKPV